MTCFVEKAMTWDTPSACVLLGAYVRKRAVVTLHVVSQVEKEKYSDENFKKITIKKKNQATRHAAVPHWCNGTIF